MAESVQKKLGRVRPPRVQIMYDVETGSAVEKKELPFVVGVMADLSGHRAAPLPKLKDRKLVEIDQDNFDQVMEAAGPRLALRVPNRLQPETGEALSVELTFEAIGDFDPVAVVERVPALRELFEARKRLRDLLTKLDGNDELDALLRTVVASTDEQGKLKAQLATPAANGAG